MLVRTAMPYSTVITANELKLLLGNKDCAIVDCRFSLDDTEHGRRDYLESHIPGAVYAHLDHDLSGTKIPGKTGRHPLPELRSFAETLSSWGIDAGTQVVAYDDGNAAMAARLWWMLHWAGHPRAAVLDGGWNSWRSAGFPTRGGPEYRPVRHFEAHPSTDAFVTTEQVQASTGDPSYVLLDARSAPRFRGEVEPIDPVAGHIPGAVSAPFEQNLDKDGKLLPPETLRKRFEDLIKSAPPEKVICYCGSGVTAAENLLAMAHSGIGMGKLYVGSWSEWITDFERPVARGDR
jgi:thiosulfate/3-mercaptopyruvate sulfurtransferase